MEKKINYNDFEKMLQKHFNKFYSFEKNNINENWPSGAGVYQIRRKKTEDKIQYPNHLSHIIKFGESGDLTTRMNNYLNPKIKKDMREERERTAWKPRHFLDNHGLIEIAFKPTSNKKEAVVFQNKLIGSFEELFGEKPLLEGSIDKYFEWNEKNGIKRFPPIIWWD